MNNKAYNKGEKMKDWIIVMGSIVLTIFLLFHILGIITIISGYHKQKCTMTTNERKELLQYYSNFTREHYIDNLPNCKDKFDSGNGCSYSFGSFRKDNNLVSNFEKYIASIRTNILMILYRVDTLININDSNKSQKMKDVNEKWN